MDLASFAAGLEAFQDFAAALVISHYSSSSSTAIAWPSFDCTRPAAARASFAHYIIVGQEHPFAPVVPSFAVAAVGS